MARRGFAVTAGRSSPSRMLDLAREWAEQLGAELLPRESNASLRDMLAANRLQALVVAAAGGPQIVTEAGTFVYHPGMAVLRLQQLKRGAGDHLLTALGLKKGMRIFDGTLGLGADAAVASWAVGETGSVTGTEASVLLHFALSWGLRHYEAGDPELTAALRRITAVNAEAGEYLRTCGPDSFDAVYFDPMFRWPVKGSSGMDGLRPLSYERPLDAGTVAAALRAAPLVVIKERSEKILREYGCTEFTGGRYSSFRFGIIRRQTWRRSKE